MTENTPEQQHLRAAAERVGEKLQRFYEALPADEQMVLSLALRQISGQTSEPAEDVTGYFFAFPMTWPMLIASQLKDELIEIEW
jgi:hypothetical protein